MQTQVSAPPTPTHPPGAGTFLPRSRFRKRLPGLLTGPQQRRPRAGRAARTARAPAAATAGAAPQPAHRAPQPRLLAARPPPRPLAARPGARRRCALAAGTAAAGQRKHARGRPLVFHARRCSRTPPTAVSVAGAAPVWRARWRAGPAGGLPVCFARRRAAAVGPIDRPLLPAGVGGVCAAPAAVAAAVLQQPAERLDRCAR